MAGKRLTEATIRNAVPRAKAFYLWDPTLAGFGCRVTPKGVRTFVLRYRTEGKDRMMTIGHSPAVSLKDARAKADRVRLDIRDGRDPLAERETRKAAPTFAEAVERYFEEWVPSRQARGLKPGPRTVADYRLYADRTALPALGAKRIADITRQDIEAAVAPRGRTQQRLTLAFISQVIKRCIEWEWLDWTANPMARIERPPQGKRDRALAPAEIAALSAELAQPDESFADAAIRFMILSGFRIGEVERLEWEHIDWQEQAILLPTTKTGRQRRPLNDAAADLLRRVPRVAGRPRVFAVATHTIRRRLEAAAKRAGIEHVRPHDLRATNATRMAASGATLTAIRDALGHADITMAAHYAKRDVSTAKAAQDKAASEMAALMGGDKIVPIRRRS